MSGNCATGIRSSASAPASEIRIERTIASRQPVLDHHIGADAAAELHRAALRLLTLADHQHEGAALVLQHRGARDDDGLHLLGALHHHRDELPGDQLAVAGRAGPHPVAAWVRDQRADQQRIRVAVHLGVDELDPPGLVVDPAIGQPHPHHHRIDAAAALVAVPQLDHRARGDGEGDAHRVLADDDRQRIGQGRRHHVAGAERGAADLAVDRGHDVGIGEVDLGHPHQGLGAEQRGIGRALLRLGVVQGDAGAGAGGLQLPRPVQRHPGIRQRRLGRGDLGPGPLELGLEGGPLDAEQHLPGGDLLAFL
jgi:hypothetical protein